MKCNKKLSDIAEISVGFPFQSKLFNQNHEGFKLIRGKNVGKGFLHWGKDAMYYANVESINKNYIMRENDVVLAMDGNVVDNKSLVRKKDLPSFLVQRVARLRAKDGIDQLFLWYIVNTHQFEQYINGVKTGTTIQHISAKQIGDFMLDVPNLETQQKIVRILSVLDQKIELNNNEGNTLQSIIDTQYRKVFSENENNNKVKASDLFDYEGGYSYTSAELADESDIGMMTIKNFERTGGFKVDGFKALSPKKGTIKTAALYDIFISCTDVTQNADIIGNAVMLLDTDKYSTVTYSMDLVRIIPKINRFALYAILNSKDFKSFALGYKSGTTVLHLNKKCLSEYEVALPDNKSLDIFSATVEKACKKVATNLSENRNLSQIRDALLPKLMSGEINLDKVGI